MDGHLKVIARFTDGRMVRGYTDNFWATRPQFNLHEVGTTDGQGVVVQIADLKAVFIVKSFEGGGGHADAGSVSDNLNLNGTPMRVRFKDGESILGSTMSYDPRGQGFFLFPADPRSNNERIFIVNAAVACVEQVKLAAR